MIEGSRPEFELGSYDSQGGAVKKQKEKAKAKVVNKETGKEEEVEVDVEPQE